MNSKTPKELLDSFYKDNNLGWDGGQSSPYVKIELTKKIFIYFPNFDARRKAVTKHDIHHLVTGYSASSLIGESEISAWEIASGCKKYWTAFFIDISGVIIGAPLSFWSVLKAFTRGRRTKNLYHDFLSNEEALNTNLNELQTKLLLDKHSIDSKSNILDFLLFVLFLVFGTIYSLLILPLFPLIIVYTFYVILKTK